MDSKPQQEISPGVLSGACREKYWKELNDAEKIERIHMVVKELINQLNRTAKVAGDAHRIAEDHKHGPHGEPMMPIGAFNRTGGEESMRRRDNEYF